MFSLFSVLFPDTTLYNTTDLRLIPVYLKQVPILLVGPGSVPKTEEARRMCDGAAHPVYVMPGDERKEFSRFPIVVAWNGRNHFVPTTLTDLDKVEAWKMGMAYKHMEGACQYLNEVNPLFTDENDKTNYETLLTFNIYLKNLCKKRAQQGGHSLTSLPSSTLGPEKGDTIFTPKLHSHTRGYGLTTPSPAIYTGVGGNIPVILESQPIAPTAPSTSVEASVEASTMTELETTEVGTSTTVIKKEDASVQTDELVPTQIVETEPDRILMDVDFPVEEIIIEEDPVEELEQEEAQAAATPASVSTGDMLDPQQVLKDARALIYGNKTPKEQKKKPAEKPLEKPPAKPVSKPPAKPSAPAKKPSDSGNKSENEKQISLFQRLSNPVFPGPAPDYGNKTEKPKPTKDRRKRVIEQEVEATKRQRRSPRQKTSTKDAGNKSKNVLPGVPSSAPIVIPPAPAPQPPVPERRRRQHSSQPQPQQHSVQLQPQQHSSQPQQSSSSQGNTLQGTTLHYVNKQRWFRCNICGKDYTHRSDARSHVEGHMGKNYACTECPLSYTTKKALNVHMKKHLGERRATCSECGFSSDDYGKMKIHSFQQHGIGEPPQACPVCNKTFENARSFSRHVENAHRDKDLQCPYCTKKFKHLQNLNIHLGADHKGMPKYFCPECGTFFSSENALAKHKHQ